MSDFILKFWENQARQHGTKHTASWGDEYAIALEAATIDKHLPDGGNILDVGCANGFAMMPHLPKAKSMTGIDFSPAMIAQAKSMSLSPDEQRKIRFQVADVRKLPFKDGEFDAVYTTRVLINLPSWEDQMTGLSECMRVCRPGGTVIFSEAFWEPLVTLNALRALKQLPPLVEHDFNRYLKQRKLEAFLGSRSRPYEIEDFSSVYYLGSRFLRELVTDPSAYPGYTNPVNKAFYDLSQQFKGGGFGIQIAYIVQN